MSSEIRGVSQSGVLYGLIINSSGQWWNGTTFEAYASGNYATYVVTMTELGNSNVYVANFPSGISQAGTYEVFIYRRAGGSPAEGDPVVNTNKIDWTGSIIVSVSSSALSGTAWRTYLVDTLGFKRTDKDDELYAATTDAIQIMRRRFGFEEAEVDATTTDTIVTLGDYRLNVESDMGLLLDVNVEDGDTGSVLIKLSKTSFNQEYPDIAVTTDRGYPKHYCIYAGKIYIGPIPDRVDYEYRLNYSQRGGTVTSGTVGVPFTTLYRDVLADITLSRLYLAVEDYEKSAYWKSRYDESMAGAISRERRNTGEGYFTVRMNTI